MAPPFFPTKNIFVFFGGKKWGQFCIFWGDFCHFLGGIFVFFGGVFNFSLYQYYKS
jgi:hypothetical protein